MCIRYLVFPSVLIFLIWTRTVSCAAFSTVDDRKQFVISSVINDTLSVDARFTSVNSLDSVHSTLSNVCDRLQSPEKQKRTACCTPSDVKHLHNVLLTGNKFVVFTNDNSQKYNLPGVTSVRTQQKINFNMGVEHRNGTFSSASPQCSGYFNGTLHVVGKSTVKNVYHALADNVLPLIAQIILDAHLSPEHLHLPRMLLLHGSSSSGAGGKDEVPHLAIMHKLFSGGTVSAKAAQGMCFRRVVWGHGPHLLYVDSMVALRRKASEFLRLLVLRSFDIKMPQEFLQAPPASSSGAPLLVYGGGGIAAVRGPLRIVVYSRGSSGKGRSMKGEESLVAALQQRGAAATLCCDFGRLTLDQQLSYAVHADVIMGLHGAAIAHGVFMAPGSVSLELKTLYGYDSVLFGLVADSRRGVHAQVDVRKYFVPGGHKPVDDALVGRTMAVLDEALRHRETDDDSPHRGPTGPEQRSSQVLRARNSIVDKIVTVSTQWKGDMVYGPASMEPMSTGHILGPLQSNQTAVCEGMQFARVRRHLEVKGDRSFHCDICTTYVVR